jgi:hypothetical protein
MSLPHITTTPLAEGYGKKLTGLGHTSYTPMRASLVSMTQQEMRSRPMAMHQIQSG